ncbi:hypothetical protein E4U41_004032 [Claviceps citrina]|nr:hypothetical protein E4U41_004032 [Claviceps citrina]
MATMMPLVPSRVTLKTSRSPGRRNPDLKTYLDDTATNNRFLTSVSSMKLKRWDGAKRICTNWDASQEDSELVTRNGNCLIYLHSYKDVCSEKDAKLVASFRLPFSLLLANKCYALIERCLVICSSDGTPGPRRSVGDVQKWYRSNSRRTIELFIPPPQGASERQIQRHQIMTRNFFAWVLGRSLVGETLGEALVGLLECMYEYRPGDNVDNVADLVRYLNEEGYLCLAGQPDHALAVLRLAETFRLDTLYLQALSHCVGNGALMSGRPDLQHVSLATRKLMRDSERELVARLQKTSDMLKTFLDHELSESQLGIPAGIRAHLERFRSFLLSFYSAKLGYYPPVDFDGRMYRVMARDFTALYNLLVDEGYSSSEAMPSVAVGGICTLQLIQTFDARNGFQPMKHPLPRLPLQDQQCRQPGRMSWLPRRARQRNDDGQMNHVSLVQASNWREESFGNGLVRAYRAFEEECALSPMKLDRKHEKVSLVDGRKIRWILIYAVHQTLQHATQLPVGVADDPRATQVVSIARDTRVPWRDGTLSGGMRRCQTEPVLSRLREQLEAQQSDAAEKKIEIKPDIDYFALTHKREEQTPPPSRTNSFKQVFSRSGSIRISMRRRNKASSTSTSSSSSSPVRTTAAPGEGRSAHHEIIAHGYGQEQPRLPLESASQSASTGPGTRSSNVSTVPSSARMEDTLWPMTTSRLPTSWEAPLEMPASSRRWSHQEGSSGTVYTKSPHRRPTSTALDGGYKYAVARDSGDWTAERRLLDGGGGARDGVGDVWEQYAHLGGLTEMR